MSDLLLSDALTVPDIYRAVSCVFYFGLAVGTGNARRRLPFFCAAGCIILKLGTGNPVRFNALERSPLAEG